MSILKWLAHLSHGWRRVRLNPNASIKTLLNWSRVSRLSDNSRTARQNEVELFAHSKGVFTTDAESGSGHV